MTEKPKLYTIKPLEWRGAGASSVADCIVGRYGIDAYGSSNLRQGIITAALYLNIDRISLGNHSTIEGAQMACWQDYERRISAALVEDQS